MSNNYLIDVKKKRQLFIRSFENNPLGYLPSPTRQAPVSVAISIIYFGLYFTNSDPGFIGVLDTDLSSVSGSDDTLASAKAIKTYVDTQINDGIATITINRPEAMNALNETVVNQLGIAVNAVNAIESVHTIVLDGAGIAFVAGADVKFFVDKLKQDSFEDIFTFTQAGHDLLNSIEKSNKITIALTTGITYGGGLEFALSCDYRIGSKKTEFRFPETGIGIYPGLGGTQRMSRMVGVEIARWAILAGNRIDGELSKKLGIIDEYSSETELENTILKLAGLEKSGTKFRGKPIEVTEKIAIEHGLKNCLLYTSPSPRDLSTSRMPSSA